MDPDNVPPPTHVYKSFVFPSYFQRSTLEKIKDFNVKEDDIWILSFIRSGTHWLAEIILHVIKDEQQTGVSHASVLPGPLELTLCKFEPDELTDPRGCEEIITIAEKTPSPRIIFCHLHLQLLPDQLFKVNPKILFMCRNPKDILVSITEFKPAQVKGLRKPWEELVQEFATDKAVFGSCVTHAAQCWELRHLPNFKFMKYEDMKKDINQAIRDLGDFFGRKLSDEWVAEIAELTSANSMKERYDNDQNKKEWDRCKRMFLSPGRGVLVRKGVVGEWKNYFTVAQNEHFDRKIEKGLLNSTLRYTFE